MSMRSLLIALLSCIAALAHGQEIVTLATRQAVTQSYLLVKPSGSVLAAALLFPGGQGNIHLRDEGGQIQFSPNNFLVRTRSMFAEHGVAVAVMDAPSDQQSGMPDDFRT